MPTQGAIPLQVPTGVLGSGGTTLLARSDEDVRALPSGCLCHALRGEPFAAPERLAALRPTRARAPDPRVSRTLRGCGP